MLPALLRQWSRYCLRQLALCMHHLSLFTSTAFVAADMAAAVAAWMSTQKACRHPYCLCSCIETPACAAAVMVGTQWANLARLGSTAVTRSTACAIACMVAAAAAMTGGCNTPASDDACTAAAVMTAAVVGGLGMYYFIRRDEQRRHEAHQHGHTGGTGCCWAV